MDILNSFVTDALKEIGSIGMGNATTSLSRLVNRKVRLNLSDAGMLQQEEVAMLIPDSITMAGIMLRIEGDLTGVVLLLFEFNNAVLLSSLMLGDAGQADDPAMHESALAEMGNIIAGSYLGAITSFLSIGVRHSTPEIAIGPVLKVLKKASSLIDSDPGELLNIETMFMVHDAGDGKGLNTIYGDMFLLLDPMSLDKLRDSIGKMLA